MNPKYPIYIVSKKRADSRLTSKALERMGVPYYIVIEEDDYKDYSKVIDKNKILILPQKYINEYDTCDNRGNEIGKGPGCARNFAWDHSISLGSKFHWVMDDNILDFLRVNNCQRIRVLDGTIFRCMEDFTERYKNVYMSGPAYRFFNPSSEVSPPFVKNTRIYSCNLIRNDIPYRWRGRYNEDTDLSLRILKDGFCTIQFNAFLQGKVVTQQIKGGNTEVFYSKEGTFNKSKMLEELHPDVAKVVYKFGRIHHFVDYTPFKKNKLIRDESIKIDNKINNYGMILVEKEDW
jgi:hypothetical protein